MQEEHTKTYLDYLLTKGYNKTTSHRKYRQVQAFLNHYNKTINQITTLDITNYYHHIKNRPNQFSGNPVQLSTIHTHIVSIAQFYQMLLDTGTIQTIPPMNIPRTKQEKNNPIREILSPTEIQKLYKVANVQETILLHLSYGCGLRISELAAVNKADIYLKDAFLIIPQGKNNKRRLIPLTQKISTDLALYLSQQNPNQPHLIQNSKGEKMQKWTYNTLLKKLLKKIKLPQRRIQKLSIHSLRHSIATHLLTNGMELEKVSYFLGHTQLETTQTYTHISIEQLKEIKHANP